MHKIGQGSQADLFLIHKGGYKIAVKKFHVIEGTARHKRACFETLILEKIRHANLISSQQISIQRKMVAVAVPMSNTYKPHYKELPELQYEIAMNYYPLGSLDRYISILSHDSSLHELALYLFKEVLHGLDHLHKHKIIHGSIKPDNILITNEGHVIITDYGDAALMAGVSEIFGVDSEMVWSTPAAQVTPYDDLLFHNRPNPRGEVTLYQSFPGFDQGELDEENIGLLALFRKMVPMHLQSKSTEDFYQFMLDLSSERSSLPPSLCNRLLNHPFMKQRGSNQKVIELQKRVIFHAQVQQSTLYKKLQVIYSKEGIEKFRHLQSLFSQLVAMTPTKTFSDLTTRPLRRRPPIGFQETRIEFALRRITNRELENFNKLIALFINHQIENERVAVLQEAVTISSEVYRYMKMNSNPATPPSFFVSKEQKTLFETLYEKGWIIRRIYGTERPAIPSIAKVARGYIAIEPQGRAKRKVIIAFMGAEVLPRLSESWWTNDRAKQAEIWREVNFKRSHDKHTGLLEYADQILPSVESALSKLIGVNSSNIEFELTGHSTGGVLGILMARRLKKIYPDRAIHTIFFGTPAFMNIDETSALHEEFPNDSKYSLFNIISLMDPALGIYGEGLYQPHLNSVFMLANDFSGRSFLDVHAASKGTTMAHIKNHGMDNYRLITSNLVQKIGQSFRSKL